MTGAVSCACGRVLTANEILQGLRGWSGGAAGTAVGACPTCQAGYEVRLARGSIEWGASYWAGSFHFEPFATVDAAGLEVELVPPDDLMVRFEGVERRFEGPKSSLEWLEVFPGAELEGTSLRDADFEGLGLRVVELQRGGKVVPVDPEHRLEAWDRLLFSGAKKAIRDAWGKMHR